jgi:transposase
MPKTIKREIKTDKRDAAKIAKCLAFNTYSQVYVLSEEDNAVKEYIRMRNDEKDTLKRIKQQILAFLQTPRQALHRSFQLDSETYSVVKKARFRKCDFTGNISREDNPLPPGLR